MIMVGCDFHAGFEEIAMLDTKTGQRHTRRLSHALGQQPVRQFYAGLEQPVRVGLEASGYSQWFEEMLEELDTELWVADPARVRKMAPRKQKTDRNDARLLLELLGEGPFSPHLGTRPNHTRSAPVADAPPQAGRNAHSGLQSVAGHRFESRHPEEEEAMEPRRTGAVTVVDCTALHLTTPGRTACLARAVGQGNRRTRSDRAERG